MNKKIFLIMIVLFVSVCIGVGEVCARMESNKKLEPQIHINVLYVPHGFQDDIKGLGRLLEEEETDIFIPEMMNWDNSTKSALVSISNGEDKSVVENVINKYKLGVQRQGLRF